MYINAFYYYDTVSLNFEICFKMLVTVIHTVPLICLSLRKHTSPLSKICLSCNMRVSTVVSTRPSLLHRIHSNIKFSLGRSALSLIVSPKGNNCQGGCSRVQSLSDLWYCRSQVWAHAMVEVVVDAQCEGREQEFVM